LSDARVARGCYLSERAVGHSRIRISELRVVQEVEELRAIFQPVPFTESEGLVRREIDVNVPGPINVLRPTLPKVLLAGVVKALVVNHCASLAAVDPLV